MFILRPEINRYDNGVSDMAQQHPDGDVVQLQALATSS